MLKKLKPDYMRHRRIKGWTTKHGYVVFNLLYYTIKSLLFGVKRVFKQQYLQMFGLKLNKYEHFCSFKWMEI